MTLYETAISHPLLQQAATLAGEAVVLEWRQQGHELTGQAAQELEVRIVQRAGEIHLEGWVLDYMATLNRGVGADKIPYSPGSGASSSKYIEGLISYAQKRMGASRQEAERIAFAIASTHKREGMPSRGSKRFSSSGKRTGFIDEAMDKAADRLGELIELAFAAALELLLESYFKSILPNR